MTSARRSLSRAAFTAWVDDLTRAAIMDGATGFTTLIHRLPGVYPTELLASIHRLAGKEMIGAEVAISLCEQAAANSSTVVDGRSLLPPPHPLDYEWRFTPDAARTLLNHAADLTTTDADWLLFGTPGLAVEALSLPTGRRLAFLAEPNGVTDRVLALNNAMGKPLSIAFCSGGLPRESADVVFLDPPWYLDFIRSMLTGAAHACRSDGFVLISLPPDGTRPSADADRQAIIAFAGRLGLSMITYSPLAIGYQTPFFERNALSALGIYPPSQWRRGDLVVFKKSHASTRPPLIYSARARDWTEVSIGRMRLFIRGGSQASLEEARLISIVEGDILSSVSRRDPRRQLANVWTSGNRIFLTDNPQLVLEAAISSSDGANDPGAQPRLWGTIREREVVERVAKELLALAALEEQEESNPPLAATKRSLDWTSSTTNCWSKSEAMNFG